VFVWFVVLYAAVRFLLEYLRADDRGGLLVFSTSQWMGLVFIALAVAVHVVKMRSLRRAGIV